MSNQDLYDAALNAINDLFDDMTFTKGEALENLKSLLGEIEIMIDGLESDIANEEESVE